MNILYIGPYRQIDYIGQVSNVHIESIKKYLKKDDHLVTRPLYIDSKLSAEYISYDTENVRTDSLDLIVEYVPVDFVASLPSIRTFVIPMIDPKLCSISQSYNYNILNTVDKVLVDNDKQKHILKKCSIKTSIEIYNDCLVDEKSQQFNLDVSETNYKFGFIGSFALNQQILNKIIRSFLSCYRASNKTHLYLFLRGSDKDKIELDAMIEKSKKDLRIPEYVSCITSIFGIWDKQESITALNSIDCYISLNDDYRYTLYEKFFMESDKPNRFLISRNNVESIEVPLSELNSLYDYADTLHAIHTQDLYHKMLNAASSQSQKYKKTETPSLGSIVCKQVL